LNVLSLFDGISTGYYCLKKAGVNVKKYFASEINPNAIKISEKNYPDVIRLGDICTVDSLMLPRIDLIIGGSPCQGFSRAGKNLNFDDPRSKLFFEYLRIFNDIRNYNPDVKFRIGYSPEEIYIQYLVTENDIKAEFGEDAGSKPYTDSCVEFFAIPGEGGEYYNLELNCIGKGTFAGGAQRTDRTRYGDDVLGQIRREASLGSEAFGTRTLADNGGEPYTWKLTVALPVKLYSLSEVKPLKGRKIKANFYKCGDNMPQKHYLSWHPIAIEKPNFHRPDHFGTLYFE
jgi:hypothetical protein